MTKKYKITRATLRFEDGTKDMIHSSIETDCIEEERKRIKLEFSCKSVEFRFFENNQLNPLQQ